MKLEKLSKFRILNAEELEFISGGDAPGARGTVWEEPGFGDNTALEDLLASMGIFGSDGYDGNPIDLGGGVTAQIDLNTSSLTVSALTDIGVISLHFDLNDITVPIVTITNPDFTISGDITSQSVSGTYNVDFGGGVTGTVSGSASGDGGFSLSTGISVRF